VRRCCSDAAENVEDQILDGAQPIFDVVSENPEVQHVPTEMREACVEEHREDDRRPDELVGKGLVGIGKVTVDVACVVDTATGEGGIDLICGERTAFGYLAGNCCVLERESHFLLARVCGALYEEKDKDVESDQRPGHVALAVRRILVLQRHQHAWDLTVKAPGGICSVGGIASVRRRLDQELVRRELFSSRERARKAIAAGDITVNGAPADKPARQVMPGDAIIVRKRTRFVGRGGDKLAGALARFGVDVNGAHCLDVGSSTGGFTDALLQAGAAGVVAVDVGTHQLHEKLRADERVVVREQTDIRNVTLASLEMRVDVVVCDVSFIGIDRVFPAMLNLASPDAVFLLLIKPQFEAGRSVVSKGRGVVRDPAIWGEVLEDASRSISELGGEVVDGMVSPLKGGSGNVEFFYLVRRRTPDGSVARREEADRTIPFAGIGTMLAEAEDLT